MSVTFHLASEHVSDTSFGLDHLRCAWVPFQFAAKTKNLDVDAAIEDVFVDSSRLQKMLPAERTLGGIQEGDKQRVFAFGQRNVRVSRVGELPSAKIEPPARKPVATVFWFACRRGASPIQPPKDGAHPRKKLAQVEGLRHIVVGAKLKTDDPVDLIPAMAGDDDHRHI